MNAKAQNRRLKKSKRKSSQMTFREGWTIQMWILVIGVVVVAALYLTGTLSHPPHYR